MTKKIRTILFIILASIYVISTPFLILYSLGYRFDFAQKKIVSTGGLYLKVWPQKVQIIIDGKVNKKTGIISNELLVQGIFPKKHNFLVKKEGYYPWGKNLEIKGGEVNRVENVTLIKEKISFEKLDSEVNNIFLSPDYKKILITKAADEKTQFVVIDSLSKEQNGLLTLPVSKFNVIWSQDSKKILIKDNLQSKYFIFDYSKTGSQALKELEIIGNISDIALNSQNTEEIFFIKDDDLYLRNENTISVLKKLITYVFFKNQIIWLSKSGIVYKSDLSGKLIDTLNEKPFLMKQGMSYKIIADSQLVLIKEENSLFLLNQGSKEFEKIYSPVKDVRFSPDGSKLFYLNDHEILLSNTKNPFEKIFLIRFSEKINDCFWLNSNYLIFNVGGQIKISETDPRDKINLVDLETKITINTQDYILSNNQKIFFDEINKKLYILDQNNFFASEQITDKNNR